MKIVVIGYGSIGSRHVRILTNQGHEVSVVSQREIENIDCYKTIEESLQKCKPGYVVVANRTNEHYSTLSALARADFKGIVLVEKPLFDRHRDIPINSFSKIYVAYNLRFHPIMHKLCMKLQNESIVSVVAYTGQYLPQWRPHTDYRKGCSAHGCLGGGVLRDLSHELDYLNWLLGGWKALVALGGHFSHLEIESDDVFSLLMQTERCPVVTVQLNYLDRIGRRELLINTDLHTYKADLVKGILQVDDEVEVFKLNLDDTYWLQHETILAENGDNARYLCSLEEGLEVMRMIEAVEKSAKEKAWITG